MVKIYLYPSLEPGSVAIYTPRMTNSPKSAGIIILFAFSMPPAMPSAMITSAASSPAACQTPLPMPNTPFSAIMATAPPRVSASGAVAPNAPAMAFMSVPRA